MRNISTASRICSTLEDTDLPQHDLARSCRNGEPFSPCRAATAATCSLRCAKRPGCAAFVFTPAALDKGRAAATAGGGLCYLKSTAVAYLGRRIEAAGVTAGLCVAPSDAAPVERSVAVCLVGQQRAAAALPSQRRHALEPWDADGFVVTQLADSRADAEAAAAATMLLGPRVRLAVHEPRTALYDQRLWAQLNSRGGAAVRAGPGVGQSAGYAGWVSQLLNREACLRLVLHTEIARGSPYTTYARLRLDTLLLSPLPMALLAAAARRSDAVVVPSGDEWGGEEMEEGVCDRMVVGGAAAFRADARLWLTMRDNPAGLVPPGFVTEVVTRRHFAYHGLDVVKWPIAYCSVSHDGHCRYAEHLSNALRLLGASALQRQLPSLCACDGFSSRGLPLWGWEAGCRLTPANASGGSDGALYCITPTQSRRARHVDSGWCQLAAACHSALAAVRGD